MNNSINKRFIEPNMIGMMANTNFLLYIILVNSIGGSTVIFTRSIHPL